jgi:hypothetical protein
MIKILNFMDRVFIYHFVDLTALNNQLNVLNNFLLDL